MAVMPEAQFVSVIIPVHNGSDLISRALTSVLNQSHPIDQIIVVDDGSTDALASTLAAIGFQGEYIYQPHNGQGSAINAGLRKAQGDLITFLDHDDEWVPMKTKQQLAALTPQVDAVIGSVVNRIQMTNGQHVNREMGVARVLGASLIRREALNRVGPFASDQRVHEIVDWWSRAQSQITTLPLDQPALIRHVHGRNQTLQPIHHDRHDLISRIRDHRKRISAHE